MIIGITGQKGSGKDTVALVLVEHGYSLVRFADPLKNMLRAMYAVTGMSVDEIERRIEGDLKETPCPILSGKTPRHAMQTLGTEWRDLIDRDLWSNLVKVRIIEGGNVVLPDVRFHHEAQLVRSLGGKIFKVERPNQPVGASSLHLSETEMAEIETDFTFVNKSSIAALHFDVRNYLRQNNDFFGTNRGLHNRAWAPDHNFEAGVSSNDTCRVHDASDILS